jgi:hypothetical protein
MKYSLATLALTSATSAAFDIKAFLDDLNVSDKDSLVQIGQRMLTNIKSNSEAYLADHTATASEYPYFNFIPMFRAGVVPDTKNAVSFSAKCFPEHSAVAKTESDGTVSVSITTSGEPATDSCYDSFWLMTVTGLVTVKVDDIGETSVSWTLPNDAHDSEKWDLQQKGIRIMELMTDEATSIANLLETVLLFVPEFTQQVDPISAKRNVDFMAKYPKVCIWVMSYLQL